MSSKHSEGWTGHETLGPDQPDKAYTSAAYGFPTHGWFEFIKDDPPLLHGIVHTPRLVVFGGGFPIKEKGEMIGAIGISGGHYRQEHGVRDRGANGNWSRRRVSGTNVWRWAAGWGRPATMAFGSIGYFSDCSARVSAASPMASILSPRENLSVPG